MSKERYNKVVKFLGKNFERIENEGELKKLSKDLESFGPDLATLGVMYSGPHLSLKLRYTKEIVDKLSEGEHIVLPSFKLGCVDPKERYDIQILGYKGKDIEHGYDARFSRDVSKLKSARFYHSMSHPWELLITDQLFKINENSELFQKIYRMAWKKE